MARKDPLSSAAADGLFDVDEDVKEQWQRMARTRRLPRESRESVLQQEARVIDVAPPVDGVETGAKQDAVAACDARREDVGDLLGLTEVGPTQQVPRWFADLAVGAPQLVGLDPQWRRHGEVTKAPQRSRSMPLHDDGDDAPRETSRPRCLLVTSVRRRRWANSRHNSLASRKAAASSRFARPITIQPRTPRYRAIRATTVGCDTRSTRSWYAVRVSVMAAIVPAILVRAQRGTKTVGTALPSFSPTYLPTHTFFPAPIRPRAAHALALRIQAHGIIPPHVDEIEWPHLLVGPHVNEPFPTGCFVAHWSAGVVIRPTSWAEGASYVPNTEDLQTPLGRRRGPLYDDRMAFLSTRRSLGDSVLLIRYPIVPFHGRSTTRSPAVQHVVAWSELYT